MQAGTIQDFESSSARCPMSGCWFWLGHIQKNGYGQTSRESKKIYAHRLSYEYYIGLIPEGMDIDHVCGMRSCVNPEHLRLATRSQNMMNSKGQKRNTSGYKGVSWDKNRNKWLAKIGIDHKYINLGRFDDPRLAYEAYCTAAKIHHDGFYNLGTGGK